jgi:hypothetical protein
MFQAMAVGGGWGCKFLSLYTSTLFLDSLLDFLVKEIGDHLVNVYYLGHQDQVYDDVHLILQDFDLIAISYL